MLSAQVDADVLMTRERYRLQKLKKTASSGVDYLKAINMTNAFNKLKVHSSWLGKKVKEGVNTGGEIAVKSLIVGAALADVRPAANEIMGGALVEGLKDVPKVIPTAEEGIQAALKEFDKNVVDEGIVKYGGQFMKVANAQSGKLLHSVDSQVNVLDLMAIYKYIKGFPPAVVFFKERETTFVNLLLRLLIETLDVIDESKVAKFKTFPMRRMLKHLVEQDYYVNDDEIAGPAEGSEPGPKSAQTLEALRSLFQETDEETLFQSSGKPITSKGKNIFTYSDEKLRELLQGAEDEEEKLFKSSGGAKNKPPAKSIFEDEDEEEEGEA